MDRGGMVSHGLVTTWLITKIPNPIWYPGTMLRSYSYTHRLSSATWHPGPVPIPVPMVPIPTVPFPYPYPYLMSRTHTRTRTHDFVTCRTHTHTRTHGLGRVPLPIPMASYPYPYPYPWSVPTLQVCRMLSYTVNMKIRQNGAGLLFNMFNEWVSLHCFMHTA